MGEERVKLMNKQDAGQMQAFMHSLLNDVRALEYMLDNDWFESGIKRIGAEQEMCLVDKYGKPRLKCMEIMQDFSPEWLTTELAQFNLECNLTPRDFTGSSFSAMEAEIRSYLAELSQAAAKHDTQILLTGILPSLRKSHLSMDNLTPKPRYRALMQALRDLRGSDYDLRLEGIDELNLTHDSPLLEACNTSFQVHMQVSPSNFVQMYNIALAIAGPTLAMAANSPLLFGKRLWHETRIVLFQQSVDNRRSTDNLRDRQPRVTFGNDWLHKSILEIYREDILRFRTLLSAEEEEDAFAQIKMGKAPKLRALQVHNGTVYRWNRPCYGISPSGKPHLRIENRILPAGPTVLDEMANTAFWLGLMEGMADHYGDITKHMSFDDARDNFVKGARTGNDSKFTWVDDKKISARDLMLEELIPLSRKGLEMNQVNPEDISRYLDVIEGRTKEHATGARWMLRSYSRFLKETSRDEAITAITTSLMRNQEKGDPVHTWPLGSLDDLLEYEPSRLVVEEFMTTDVFSVHKEDILELVADMMDWRKIRYTVVEDANGHFIGLITSRLLLRHFTQRASLSETKAKLVEDLMITDVVSVGPETSILEAINLMNKHDIGCVPVVKDKEVVGIVTENNFLEMTKRLLERQHQQNKVKSKKNA
jgi:CBS domain-containing protein/gamma-glutamylcysteine synthetase